jgi:hypothetical protein
MDFGAFTVEGLMDTMDCAFSEYLLYLLNRV